MPHLAGSCLQSLPVFLCYRLHSASWLPFQRELFFLSNFLFVRQELPPSKETGYLVSNVLIFLKKCLGSFKRLPFVPPWISMQPTSPISTDDKPKVAVMGLITIRFSSSIYTDTLSLVPFVGWKHPGQMMQWVCFIPCISVMNYSRS